MSGFALSAKRLVIDTFTMTRRNILRLKRSPEVLTFSLISPIMFVLLFNYVFGGSINVPGQTYANFLIPGIAVQTALFSGGNTAVGLAEDMSQGVIDRFRSLPMSRAAVLTGRTLADALRSIVTNTVIFIVGLLVGFRINNGIAWFVAAFLLIILFSYAFNWGFALMALKIRSVEAVQAASFVPIFPLTFAASTFAPVENMPSWLQKFSANQPVTHAVDAIRAMTQGGDIARPLIWTLIWVVIILAVFVPLSIREFRKG